MDKISREIDSQEKITKIVQKRHEQISEIKLYFDWNNQQLYKGIARLGQNLEKFEKIYTKNEYQLKCENIISLTLSIGKIMDLNNSIKTILLSIKIFEEHKNYLNKNNKDKDNSKNFIHKFFDKKNFIPLSQNNFIKERIKQNLENKNESYKIMTKFYESLFGNDSNFFHDLDKYYNFKNIKDQKIVNGKENNNDKKEEINKNKIDKNILNNISFYDENKFYNRVKLCFKLDYPASVYTACDIFHMLYNKMMDNICYNPNFLSYIEELDEYIIEYFIKPCFNDLLKLSELIIKSEVEELNSNLQNFYK